MNIAKKAALANVVGNSVNAIGALNPAFGNQGLND